MENMLFEVKTIADNVIQIIGKADFDCDLSRFFLLNKVIKFVERAERENGIPQPNDIAQTMPANVVVHATFMFLSGADMKAFLNECKDIKF